MRLVAANTFGSWVATHSAFGAVKPGMAMLPARRRRSGTRLFELGAFGERADVVPQDRRAQRLAGGVEERRAVHLAGEADAGEPGEGVGRALAQRRDAGGDGLDPVVGVLFAPQRLRPRQRQRDGGVGDRALFGVDQQRLDRRSADVQPKKGLARADSHSFLLPTRIAPLQTAAR